jgi:hypothetical protein
LDGQGCLIKRNQPGVGQYIRARLKTGPVGTLCHGFNNGFAMDDDDQRAQFPCRLYHWSNAGRRDMGQLHARNHCDGLCLIQVIGNLYDPGNYKIKGGGVGMIRYGHSAVSKGLKTPDKLGWDELAITEEGMCVQIDHNF